MPIYEYRCVSCSHAFEQMRKMSEAPPPCPACGAAVEKQISVSSFHLKGGGWYSDHYGLKSGGGDGGGGSSGGGGE